jgi:hypothetical protein
MLLRRILHIAGVLLLAIFVASCAKDELEAPSDGSGEIRAIEEGAIQNRKGDASIRTHENIIREGGIGDEVDINDDDDEEDEDRNPDK